MQLYELLAKIELEGIPSEIWKTSVLFIYYTQQYSQPTIGSELGD